jgi:tetratricopeptide (TPR) repeat protein
VIGVLALAAVLALPPAASDVSAPVRTAPQQPEQPSVEALEQPDEADPLPVESLQQLRFGVRTERLDGELWVSVRTQDAPLRPLLEELALQTGTVFSGLERIPATVRVTADLEHRSLRQVVTWILGSVGLRADRRLDTFTLHVDADTRADLLAQAGTEYLRTLRESPNHPLADRTLFGQGLLEEDKGQPAAARLHYEGLVEAYPESPLVDDALKRCAELFMEAEEWASAAQRWSELLRLEQQSPHQVEAYEQLALCTALLGDADRTVHMLDALENIAPPASDAEHQARLYVRARAQLGQRAHRQALESLAEADAHGRTDRQKLISHELRARALAGLEEYGAASRSWLAFCELARGA